MALLSPLFSSPHHSGAYVFALHLIIPIFNHCPIDTAVKLRRFLWNRCHGLLSFYSIQRSKDRALGQCLLRFWSDRICTFIHFNWPSSKSLFLIIILGILATSLALHGHCCGFFPEIACQLNSVGSFFRCRSFLCCSGFTPGEETCAVSLYVPEDFFFFPWKELPTSRC